MSGQTRRIWEAGGAAHPDDSVLLAYIRRQPSAVAAESWPTLQQHISDCNQCQQRYHELADLSALLSGTLVQAPDAQKYPSLVGNVLEVIQDPGAARIARRKRRQAQLREDLALGKTLVIRALINAKTGVMQVLPWPQARGAKRSNATRLGVMPTTLALLLLAIVAILTFSVTASAFGLFHVPDEIIPLPLQPTATGPSNAVTSLVSQPTATPLAPSPTLKLCVTQSDKSQSRLRICGSHFTPGDKVQLLVKIMAAHSHARHALLVDAQGNFQDSWVVVTCKEYPTAVFVEDLTRTLATTTELQIGQLDQCSLPTPVSTAGP